jgi:hypothetical protein
MLGKRTKKYSLFKSYLLSLVLKEEFMRFLEKILKNKFIWS